MLNIVSNLVNSMHPHTFPNVFSVKIRFIYVPNMVTYLDQTPILSDMWLSVVSRTDIPKHAFKKIGLSAENMITILSSIVTYTGTHVTI